MAENRENTEILLRITKAIHGTMDLGQVFRRLVRGLAKVVRFDRADLMMLTEDERGLEVREADPAKSGPFGPGSVVPLEGSAAGQAIRQGKPLYTPDLQAGSKFYEDVLLQRAGLRARVCLPLFALGRSIGTLQFAARKAERFQSEDLRLLAEIAEEVGLAAAHAEAHRKIGLARERLEHENGRLREIISASVRGGGFGGESAAWRKVRLRIERVAPTDSPVLITGESGSGKKGIARTIHALSPRSAGAFVPVHCAGVSADILERELFGHEKGAFPGAVWARRGRMELADTGTVFLDEVAALPSGVQARLFRLLVEGTCERVGGTTGIRLDVRVVAATNRRLADEVLAGQFRDDLYHRLNVFPVAVPSLRDRKEDIEPMILYFLRLHAQKVNKEFTHVDRGTIERCLAYDWPGNSAELESMVRRSVILLPGPVFSMDPRLEADALSGRAKPDWTLDGAVRARLTEALQITRGKIYGPDGAARLLGMKPSTLQAKLKKLGLERKRAAGLAD